MKRSRKADRQYALVSRPALRALLLSGVLILALLAFAAPAPGYKRLAALHGDVQEFVRRRLSRADHADQRHLHELPRRLQGARHAEVLGLSQARPGDVLVAAARGLHRHLPHLHQDQRPALVHDRLHPRRERPSRRGRIRQDLPLLSRREHRRGGAGHEPAPRRGGRRRAHVRRVPQRRHRGRPDRARGPRHRLHARVTRGMDRPSGDCASCHVGNAGAAAPQITLHQLARPAATPRATARSRTTPARRSAPRRAPRATRRTTRRSGPATTCHPGPQTFHHGTAAARPLADCAGCHDGGIAAGKTSHADARLLRVPRGHGRPRPSRPSAPSATRQGSSARPPARRATARPG